MGVEERIHEGRTGGSTAPAEPAEGRGGTRARQGLPGDCDCFKEREMMSFLEVGGE